MPAAQGPPRGHTEVSDTVGWGYTHLTPLVSFFPPPSPPPDSKGPIQSWGCGVAPVLPATPQ